MEDKALIRIADFLRNNNSSIDTISPYQLERFRKVDKIIQKRLTVIRKAKKNLEDNSINRSVIAKESGFSRRITYHDELLGKFIDSYSEQSMVRKTATSASLESLQKKCRDQEEKLKQFYLRDISVQEIMHENSRLQNEIKNLQKRNTSLENQCEQLRARLENTLNTVSSSNIIPMKNKTDGNIKGE